MTALNPPVSDASTSVDRIERLARAAGGLRGIADRVATSLACSTSRDLYLHQLRDLKWLTIVSGAWEPPEAPDAILLGKCPIPPTEKTARAETPLEQRQRFQLQLFWHSVRGLVAAQFSGFSLDSLDAADSLIRTVCNDSVDERYWSKSSGATTFPYARAYNLLSQYCFLHHSISQERPKLLPHVYHYVTNSADYLQKGQPTDARWSRALWKLRSNVEELYYSTLDDKVDATYRRHTKSEIDADEALYSQLGTLLGRGQVTPSSLEIADIAGIVGGRYLNPTLQLQPANEGFCGLAVRHVLDKQNPLDGTWTEEADVVRTIDEKLRDPFPQDYVPLVYLLDLPNSVLMPHLQALTDAAERAVVRLHAQLAGYELRLDTDDFRSVLEAVYNGMMVGSTVADRFKDLLSDAELDRLGAVVPVGAVNWQKVSNSLQFRANLDEGVIAPWERRSGERPGAILVYGPPGTGKTTIAEALTTRLNEVLGARPGEGGPDRRWRFLALSPADFAREGSDFLVASAERIFRQLKRVRRCVVLLDEMEEFLRDRGPGSNQASRLVTAAFLPLLQETVDTREIILVVATNLVGTIDPAVTRRGRFDLILPLGPPDKPTREDMLEELLHATHEAGIGQRLAIAASLKIKEVVELLVRYTNGYTFSEIRDYLKELERFVPAKTREQALDDISSRADLVLTLWRIRQERVPIAMSGASGCHWRTFQDEAIRYSRTAANVIRRDPGSDYWESPELPSWGDRGGVAR